MEQEKIYKMNLHETEEIKLGFTHFMITRVAGGWLYQIYRLDSGTMTCTFVPFNNEFQKI